MSVAVAADIYCPISEMSQKQLSTSALKIDISPVYCAAVDGAYPWLMLYALAALAVPRPFVCPLHLYLPLHRSSGLHNGSQRVILWRALLGVLFPACFPSPPAQTHLGQVFIGRSMTPGVFEQKSRENVQNCELWGVDDASLSDSHRQTCLFTQAHTCTHTHTKINSSNPLQYKLGIFRKDKRYF